MKIKYSSPSEQHERDYQATGNYERDYDDSQQHRQVRVTVLSYENTDKNIHLQDVKRLTLHTHYRSKVWGQYELSTEI